MYIAHAYIKWLSPMLCMEIIQLNFEFNEIWNILSGAKIIVTVPCNI